MCVTWCILVGVIDSQRNSCGDVRILDDSALLRCENAFVKCACVRADMQAGIDLTKNGVNV